MEPIHPKLLLVATDFSAPATQALRYASALADRHGAQLVVVYADDFIPPLGEMPDDVRRRSTPIKDLVAAAHEQLVAHVEANVSSWVPFTVRVAVRGAAEAIVGAAKESKADFIVMGTHGRTGFRRLLVGSVCEAVVRTASVPVIAVSPLAAEHPEYDIRKIVCVVDYSAECAEALRVAAGLAPDARIVLVKPDDGERHPLDGDKLAQLRAWLPADLAARCEMRFAGAFTPENVATFAGLIGADLIAAGFTPRRGIGDVLLGTGTDRIVQHSECPVLVMNASALREQEVAAGVSCSCEA